MGRIVIPYTPRGAFKSYHARDSRFASIVAHRRAGKTVAAINDQIRRAATFTKFSDGRFGYVAPYRQQAKDVAWSYLKHYTAPIPGIDVSESELHVTLPNGARIRLYGSDNYDAIRGIYLDDVIMDEYADHHPQAWREVIRPALADRGGSATFIGTSKGKNAFYDIQTLAEASDDWFALRLKASETGILPQTELDAMRAQMSANEYRREMECDFEAAIEGAYFGEGLELARTQSRISDVAIDPLMSLRAYWDIGGTGAKADATAIWMVQFIGTSVRVVDYYEAQGQPLAAHVNWLRAQGYAAAECVLPHDGAAHEKIERATYEGALREAGFSARVVPNQGAGAAMMRVEAVRRLFPSIHFDAVKTKAGREALGAYHEKRDDKRNVGLGPNHDWASHSADAFGLMAVDYEAPRAARKINYNFKGLV